MNERRRRSRKRYPLPSRPGNSHRNANYAPRSLGEGRRPDTRDADIHSSPNFLEGAQFDLANAFSRYR
jgi:hypothetical protein